MDIGAGTPPHSTTKGPGNVFERRDTLSRADRHPRPQAAGKTPREGTELLKFPVVLSIVDAPESLREIMQYDTTVTKYSLLKATIHLMHNPS